MRITNNMLVNNMIGYINNNLSRMNKYQEQLATGKKISVPSDDPVVAARALKFRTDVAEVKQFQSNAKDAYSWMDVTESALDKIGEILHITKERAGQAANGTLNEKDRLMVHQEISQYKHELIQLANTTYAGRYVFSGHSTDSKLLNSDGSYATSVSSRETAIIESGALSVSVAKPIDTSVNNTFQISVDNINFHTITVSPEVYDGTPGKTLQDLAQAIQNEIASITTMPGESNNIRDIQVKIETVNGIDRIQFSLKDTSDTSGNELKIHLGRAGANDLISSLNLKTDGQGKAISKGEDISYHVGIGDMLSVNVLGTELFGTGIKGDTSEFMVKFQAFIDALGNNDQSGAIAASADMEKLLDRVLKVRADVGARMNRVELTLNRLGSDELNFSKLMSDNEDVDMAEAIMYLKNEENVYRASLSGGARIIMPTLVDFLR